MSIPGISGFAEKYNYIPRGRRDSVCYNSSDTNRVDNASCEPRYILHIDFAEITRENINTYFNDDRFSCILSAAVKEEDPDLWQKIAKIEIHERTIENLKLTPTEEIKFLDILNRAHLKYFRYPVYVNFRNLKPLITKSRYKDGFLAMLGASCPRMLELYNKKGVDERAGGTATGMGARFRAVLQRQFDRYFASGFNDIEIQDPSSEELNILAWAKGKGTLINAPFAMIETREILIKYLKDPEIGPAFIEYILLVLTWLKGPKPQNQKTWPPHEIQFYHEVINAKEFYDAFAFVCGNNAADDIEKNINFLTPPRLKIVLRAFNAYHIANLDSKFFYETYTQLPPRPLLRNKESRAFSDLLKSGYLKDFWEKIKKSKRFSRIFYLFKEKCRSNIHMLKLYDFALCYKDFEGYANILIRLLNKYFETGGKSIDIELDHTTADILGQNEETQTAPEITPLKQKNNKYISNVTFTIIDERTFYYYAHQDFGAMFFAWLKVYDPNLHAELIAKGKDAMRLNPDLRNRAVSLFNDFWLENFNYGAYVDLSNIDHISSTAYGADFFKNFLSKKYNLLFAIYNIAGFYGLDDADQEFLLLAFNQYFRSGRNNIDLENLSPLRSKKAEELSMTSDNPNYKEKLKTKFIAAGERLKAAKNNPKYSAMWNDFWVNFRDEMKKDSPAQERARLVEYEIACIELYDTLGLYGKAQDEMYIRRGLEGEYNLLADIGDELVVIEKASGNAMTIEKDDLKMKGMLKSNNPGLPPPASFDAIFNQMAETRGKLLAIFKETQAYKRAKERLVSKYGKEAGLLTAVLDGMEDNLAQAFRAQKPDSSVNTGSDENENFLGTYGNEIKKDIAANGGAGGAAAKGITGVAGGGVNLVTMAADCLTNPGVILFPWHLATYEGLTGYLNELSGDLRSKNLRTLTAKLTFELGMAGLISFHGIPKLAEALGGKTKFMLETRVSENNARVFSVNGIEITEVEAKKILDELGKYLEKGDARISDTIIETDRQIVMITDNGRACKIIEKDASKGAGIARTPENKLELCKDVTTAQGIDPAQKMYLMEKYITTLKESFEAALSDIQKTNLLENYFADILVKIRKNRELAALIFENDSLRQFAVSAFKLLAEKNKPDCYNRLENPAKTFEDFLLGKKLLPGEQGLLTAVLNDLLRRTDAQNTAKAPLPQNAKGKTTRSDGPKSHPLSGFRIGVFPQREPQLAGASAGEGNASVNTRAQGEPQPGQILQARGKAKPGTLYTEKENVEKETDRSKLQAIITHSKSEKQLEAVIKNTNITDEDLIYLANRKDVSSKIKDLANQELKRREGEEQNKAKKTSKGEETGAAGIDIVRLREDNKNIAIIDALLKINGDVKEAILLLDEEYGLIICADEIARRMEEIKNLPKDKLEYYARRLNEIYKVAENDDLGVTVEDIKEICEKKTKEARVQEKEFDREISRRARAEAVDPSMTSPASGWILKHPREFEPKVVLLPKEDIALLREVYDGRRLKIKVSVGEFDFYPRLTETIAGLAPEAALCRLKHIADQLALKKPIELEKAWRNYQSTGSFYKISKKPLMYVILDLLEKESTKKFKGLDLENITKEIARELNKTENHVYTELTKIYEIFRSTDLSEIISDWKTFKDTGNLPARFLSKQMPLNRVEMEILELLSKNPGEYKELFNSKNYLALARELLKNMKTTNNEHTVQHVLAYLKNKFNAENLDKLLAQADKLDKEGKIDLGYLSKQMPLTRVEMEILELLSRNPGEYKELFNSKNYLALARELLKNMKTTDKYDSVQHALAYLKNKFNVENLGELLAQADKLDKEGKIDLGYLSKQMPLTRVEMEILELLSKNPGEYKVLFDNQNYLALARELLKKMKTTKSESTVHGGLIDLKSKFNTENLDKLLAQADKLDKEGKIDLGYLSKQMPLTRVEMEILELLSRNPGEYKVLFDNQNYLALARELLKKMKTTKSESTVHGGLIDLKSKFNTENLDKLLAQADKLDKEGKIDLGYLSKQMPLTRVEMEILELLSKNPGEYKVLFNSKNYLALTRELLKNMKTTNSENTVQNELINLKNKFNAENLDKLLAQADKLDKEGKIDLGYLSKQMPLTRVEMEILELLSKNPGEYKELFETNISALTRELLKKMKTTNSENTVQNELINLKNKFNAENLDKLLAQADKLDKEGKIDLGYLSKQMPLTRVEMEILELLSKNPGEYKELFETNILALTRELLKKMKTTDKKESVYRLLYNLPRKFRLKDKGDLMELLEKYRDLKAKDRIFGLYNIAKEEWFV